MKKILKNIVIATLLILLYALPHSTYYIDAKALLLLTLLFCLIKYRGPESYIYYVSSLFLIYDIVRSELYTHSNSFLFLRSVLSRQTLTYVRIAFFILAFLICLILFIYSWIRIFKAVKGRRWLKLGLVLALIFPSIVALFIEHTIDLISVFFVFCFGATLFFSALLNGGSLDKCIKYLQGAFLIMVLTLTPLMWYRVNLLWGILVGGVLVIILVLLPALLQSVSGRKQALVILMVEVVIVLGFSIYQLIETTNTPISRSDIYFVQFFLLQGLLLLYYRQRGEKQVQKASEATNSERSIIV